MFSSNNSKLLTLDKIKLPIKSELKEFSSFFRNSIKSEIPLVTLITRFILRQKGKQLRPILIFLTSKMCNEVSQSTYRGAALVEILHTATLVHDDVVDEAKLRRGFPSINSVWKNKIAVLMGDYLLSTGLLIALKSNDFEILKVTSNAVKKMSEGEILQINKTRKLNIDEETYFKIISSKTASLISSCTEIGGISAGCTSKERTALINFGENLGLAFQIKDDILDYTSRTSILGKPIAGDLKEKKITLPLIHTLERATRKEKKEVLNLISAGVTEKDIMRILMLVDNYKGISYAEAKGKELIEKAKSNLEIFKNSKAKTSLLNLSDFIINRTK